MSSAPTLKSNFRLLLQLTKRDFKTRYLGSLLGGYWNIIHPIVMILIYTLVFSKIMKAKLGVEAGPFAYSIYLCSGLLAWTFFQEVVARGVNAILENAIFLKKLPFPPVVLFGASLLSCMINFLIAFGIFSIVLFIVNPVPLVYFSVYLVVIFLLAAFGFGISLGVGCLNVFMRDIQQLVSILFQIWFWFTPIVYLATLLPETATKMLYFNPAWAFIEPLHQLLFYQQFPSFMFWKLMLAWTVASLLFGVFIYRKLITIVRDQI